MVDSELESKLEQFGESGSVVASWLKKSGGKKLPMIGGRAVAPVSERYIPAINPANGNEISTVMVCGQHEVDLAVASARRAFEGEWGRLKPLDRQRLLLQVADHVERNFDQLAILDTLDMGAPIKRTLSQKRVAVGMIRYYAGLAPGLTGDTIENSVPGEFISYTLKEPVGVVGAILAWNGPLGSSIRKIAPALAAGCTMVVKPSEHATLTMLRLAELLDEAGLPSGVLNVVTGEGDIGGMISAHPDIDLVTFTGSQRVGSEVVRASSGNFKRVLVELGGKSPNIVFADANLDAAVAGAAMAIFANSGQICSAGSRLLLDRAVYDEFLERLVDFTNGLTIGDGLDRNTEIGPLVSHQHLAKVRDLVRIGKAEGAAVLTDEQVPIAGCEASGNYMRPTIFGNVSDRMTIVREEIFGPVLAVVPFVDANDAVRIANATPFGLGSGIWTENINKAHGVSRNLRTGSVWINCYNTLDPSVPFGGYKQSGYGRERGREHIEEHLELKSVWTQILPFQ